MIEICRTKKKCGFRGFHTSCPGSQMNPSMGKRATKRRLRKGSALRIAWSEAFTFKPDEGTMAYDKVAIKFHVRNFYFLGFIFALHSTTRFAGPFFSSPSGSIKGRGVRGTSQ